LFFFLLCPRPPISTLFPYTTLFRSGRTRRAFFGAGYHARARDRELGARSLEEINEVHSGTGVVGHDKEEGAGGIGAGLEASPQLDRKSTRLNSSHEWISYAVFCLKK